jgi:hypothetical protein
MVRRTCHLGKRSKRSSETPTTGWTRSSTPESSSRRPGETAEPARRCCAVRFTPARRTLPRVTLSGGLRLSNSMPIFGSSGLEHLHRLRCGRASCGGQRALGVQRSRDRYDATHAPVPPRKVPVMASERGVPRPGGGGAPLTHGCPDDSFLRAISAAGVTVVYSSQPPPAGNPLACRRRRSRHQQWPTLQCRAGAGDSGL